MKIYEAIITHYDGSTVPISFEQQSGEFQEYCSKQLYHLNRRKGELKDFAMSFAEAAHRLLVRSAAAPATASRRQLRQYTQLYVRVTTGDMEWQFEKLLELIDAGVFVLRGGPDVPRTKTRDSNPIQYFILTYRKLYGLSSYIGLSNRDRFELSGKDLIAWLQSPAAGADILGRNLGLREVVDAEQQRPMDDDEAPDVPSDQTTGNSRKNNELQLTMPMPSGNQDLEGANYGPKKPMPGGQALVNAGYASSRLPVIAELHDLETRDIP